ncbi:hypothetical protein BH23GEM7_BH23GEM7_04030 [soil metagenome]
MDLSLGGTRRPILWMPPVSKQGLYPNRMRRVLNVVVAALLLLFFLPLMLVIALLVKLSSAGPIFYSQTRVGIDRRRSRPLQQDGRRRIDYGGKLFTMYKFRTMYTDADCAGEVWAQPDDPRVTPIGRVLRRYRLDELPQLVNVLLGDMNIVGPRPEQPKIFADLREQIERYPVRQRVLPGITGWAQINHHYDCSVDDVKRKLNYDLEYVERHCAREDLRIMFRTVPVIVFKQGGW